MTNILDQLMEADPLPQPSTTQWSENQQAIFTACRETSANLLVNAVAGSGKSTTLREATRHLLGSNLFLAFNKSIVDDMAQHPIQGDVKTLNSLGAGVLRRNRPMSELDKYKNRRLLKQFMKPEDYDQFAGKLSAVISLAKSNCIGIQRGVLQEDFVQLMNTAQTEVPFDRIEDFGFICMQALDAGNKELDSHDFDDQVYVPLREGWRFNFWSNVLVDEDQDLNPLQHLLLDRMHQAGSRIIGVGDRWQSIYAFRGAMTNSVDQLKERFQCLELPLSISYRCSQAVVREAQAYCPLIQARAGAPQGLVLYQEDNPDVEGLQVEDPKFWPETTMVLCRNNAPLFRAILRYVRAKRACRVRTNFLDSFRSFFEGFQCTTTLELDSKLDIWFGKEKSAAEKLGHRGKVAALQDKFDTAKLLCREYREVRDILRLLEQLGDSRTGTIFSTIHKAKGLEADHVYLLRPDLCPSPFAITPEAKQQELNLLYVAITRAKLSFTYGVPLF